MYTFGITSRKNEEERGTHRTKETTETIENINTLQNPTLNQSAKIVLAHSLIDVYIIFYPSMPC